MGLRYQEVPRFTPWGARASPKLCNSEAKQPYGVEGSAFERWPAGNIVEAHDTGKPSGANRENTRKENTMQRVFVLGSDRKPLDPCHPARARKLLKQRRAAVFRRYPFTIILKDRTTAESVTHPHRLKVDPGSKTTGLRSRRKRHT